MSTEYTKAAFWQRLSTLKRNKADDAECYSLYVSFVKESPDLVRNELLPEYEQLLDSNSSWLKQAGFFALLFKLKIQNPIYLEKAIATLSENNSEDYSDIKHWTTSALGIAYEATKHKQLLTFLWDLYKKLCSDTDDDADFWLRGNTLEAMLMIFMPVQDFNKKQEQGRKNWTSTARSIARYELLFENELLELAKYCQDENY